ncbi:hypothetical protein NEMBOFW57_008742 [Staphylotrichum longicolle]|uniref:Uncharacterized protein n=1 Tax=Staphylotrichum longicolle TaxID=669026 RepID=A0AAD4EVP5_9PEZI|nr:hypothetical protein NEMBOFW57_008742 [Staphylotrichum longicolle]
MKAAFFALFSFAVSALATPIIAERQLETQANEIDQLTELVKLHTANINKTTTAVQDNPSTEQQNAAAAALAPDFEAITEALKAATTSVAKRGWASLVEARTGGGGGGGACPQDCLLIKIQLLVWEIACTLRFVIVKLGLACVLAYLKPLLLALVGLIKSLDKVVVAVLILVKSLLSLVLGAVAALLLELIF